MWLLDKLLRPLVKRGELTLIDHRGREHLYGAPDPQVGKVTVRLKDASAGRDIARNPQLGAGEAWMDGRLEVVDGEIVDLLRFIRATAPWESGKGGSGLAERGNRIRARLDRLNWRRRAKRNVAHHYDLGNAFYELFLDEDLQYSCAYFTDPDVGLEQAQKDKKAHIAAKLHLKPGQRVLDIGCGWGGMALYLHKKAGVDVLGITLSEEQLARARERAEQEGVSDRVKFELIDYRDVEGPFDRIVSVGMFEHVGPPHYRTFFRKCRDLLAEDGVMLLHTIGRMGPPSTTDLWTAKYIFPGGYIPAMSEVIAASEREKLIASDIETLRLHYFHTIRHWYERARRHRAEIVAMYDERFYRMWLFYLAGAMVSFEHGQMVNFQFQYVRSRHALPITRDYMAEAETRFRAGGGR